MCTLFDIVSFVKSSLKNIHKGDEGDLHCDYIVGDENLVITYLYEYGYLDDFIYDNPLKKGMKYHLRLRPTRLARLGFYYTKNLFLMALKEGTLTSEYYIYEIDESIKSPGPFIKTCLEIERFRKALEKNSAHMFEEGGIYYYCILREQSVLILDADYSVDDITPKLENSFSILHNLTSIFEEDSERKLIYINELIDYLQDKTLSYLLSNISDFANKAEGSYQLYLSKYNGRAAKLEIDQKIVEFTDKLNQIISDVQVKLIAIPTAFVLAISNMDWNSSSCSVKNVAILISLFIFAVLLQIFLCNQYTLLRTIQHSVDRYVKEMSSIVDINRLFKGIRTYYSQQWYRLIIVNFILWIIPIITVVFYYCKVTSAH